MAILLIDSLLSLLLRLLKPSVNPRQRLLRQHQARRDNRLPRGDVPIAPALLVLGTVDIEDVALDAVRDTDGVGRAVVDDAADLLGVFADDGEARVDLRETLVT